MTTFQPERELKILLTQDQYHQLLETYHFQKPIKQVNTYFDYRDELKNSGSALRIRSLKDQNLLTLKRPLDAITKKEYEYPVPDNNLDQVPENIWKQIKQYVPEKSQLQPIATFTTYRSLLITDQGEFCLDKNVFSNKIDYELEYEYKSEHNGIEVLNNFLKPIGLTYTKNGPSKIKRALTD